VDGGLLSALADLLLPRTCAGCELPGAVLCRRCAALLTVPHLAQPRRFPAGFPPTVAAGEYTGPVRPAVNAFKERGRAELARPLGAALAVAVAGVLAGLPAVPAAVRLVPVPSSRAALRTRGRDHVRELTGRAVAELRAAGLPAAEVRLLRRTGRARDSAGLSAAQRRTNLAGTFARRVGVPPLLPAGTVLVVVDDVVTSGATLTEAAAVLEPAAPPGGPPVLAAVVAATPRRVAAGPTGRRGKADRSGCQGRLSGPGNGD
jgi:predicted amidophosphoribosyltransferase